MLDLAQSSNKGATMNKAMWWLNFMYSMERFATAIYRVQKGGFSNNAYTTSSRNLYGRI